MTLSEGVHLVAILNAPVFLLTHPEISFELLDAKYMLVEIKVTNESTNAESEIERVENFLILQAYAF